jgi:hypothetical protein
MDELKEATKHYYSLKKTDKQLRATHLERLASAVASKGNLKRENILKQLRLKESQWITAWKIKFLRGKLNKNSTTTVTAKDSDGSIIEITNKREMEKRIIISNKKKFRQSFRTPFYNFPYNKLFGYKGLTPSAQKVLDGTFIPPDDASCHIKDFLSQLLMPECIKSNWLRKSFMW